MVLTLDIDRPEALHELAMLLPGGAEGRGEVQARLRTGGQIEPLVRLGKDFQLDGELAERLALIEGVANIALTAKRGAGHLRLVA
jgi:DNA polymerase-3 subunit alpha